MKKNNLLTLLLTSVALLYGGMTFGQVSIGIGSNEGQNIPFEPYFGYSYTQSIYLQSEVNAAGNITSIQWYFSGTSSLDNNQDVTIWMGHSTKTNFASSTDWEPIGNLTQVYTGTPGSPAAPGWITITLDTPFSYNNTDNLIIAVDENMPGYNSFDDAFYCSDTGPDDRSIYYYSDGVNPDPSAPPTASGTTSYIPNVILGGIVQSCPTPTALTATNISDATADLSWTAGGTATTWEVEYGATGFIQGSGTTVTGVTNPYPLTGLTAETTYDYYVRSDCGGGDISAWAGPFTFTTPCAAIVPPAVEDFATFIPNCWEEAASGDLTTGPTGLGTGVWTSDGFENNGTTGAVKITLSSDVDQDWLLSPNYDLTTGAPHEVRFDFGVFDGTSPGVMGSDDQVVFLISTDFGTTWTPLFTYDNTYVTNAGGNLETFDLSAYAGQTVSFAFWGSEGTVNDPGVVDAMVDNFEVRTIPTCPEPMNVAATNITETTADLSWTAGGTETLWNLEYGPAGFTQGTGTVVTGVTNPYPLSGLSPATNYDFYVQADCGAGDLSPWSSVASFSTAIPVAAGVNCTTMGANANVIFSEEFDDNSAGWTGDINGGNGTWEIPDAAGSSNTGADNAHSGGSYMNYEASNTSTNQGSIVSPAIDLTAALDDVELSFWMHAFGASMGTLEVGVGTDPAGPFTTEFTWSGQLQTSGSDPWQNVGVNLSAYIGQTIYIQFTQIDDQGSFTGDMSIDLVEVSTCAACASPSNLAVNNITATSADLSWTENGTATVWNIEYDSTGFTQGTGTVVTGVTNPSPLTGLTANTTYDFYVQADCGGSLSTWAGPFTFTTPCAVYTAPYCEDFEDAGALDACWAHGAMNDADWSVEDGSTPSSGTGPSGPHEGMFYIFTETSNTSAGDTAQVYSPIIDLSALTTPRLTFFYHVWDDDDTGDGILDVSISDNGGPYTSIWSVTGNQGNAWQEAIVDLSAYAGSTAVQFQITTTVTTIDNTFETDWAIDLFCVEETPSCLKPTALAASNVTESTVDLSWTAGGTETLWNIEYGPVGFTQGTGTVVTGVTNPYTLTGLSSATDYDFYVQADCGAGDLSSWSTIVGSFTTAIPVAVGVNCTTMGAGASIIFSEEFDDNSAGWTGDINGGNGTWEIPNDATSLNTGADNAHSGGSYMNYEASSSSVNQGSIVSPAIDLTAALDDVELSFWMHAFGASMGTLEVGIGTDPAGPFTTEFTWSGQLQTSGSDPWQNVGVNLSAYIGQTIYIQFTQIDDQGDFTGDMSIDLVEVSTCASCPSPSNLAVNNITATSADLSWTENGSATAWDIEIVPAGTAPTGTPTYNDVTNPYTISPLTIGTDYDVYVRADCGMDDTDVSLWTGPFALSTLPGCAMNVMATQNPNCGNYDVTISWDTLPAATGYNIYVGTAPGLNDIANPFDVGTDTAAIFVEPFAATDYYYTVVPYNTSGEAVGCMEMLFTTAADSCACVPAPGSGDGEGITNVTMGTINNSSLEEPGFYGDYTSLSTDVSAGDVLNIDVELQTGYTYDVWAWVDWNGDTDFEDADEEYYLGESASTNPTVLSSSITVPATAMPGSYIIRIGGADFGLGDTSPSDPCYTGSFASFEDYTLNVVEPCVAPTGLDTANVTATTADLMWMAGGTETVWDVEYGPAGFTPGTGTIISGLSTNNYTATDLMPGTDYEFYACSACGALASDVVISGVLDGPLSGGTKLIEVYALKDVADLSDYGIGLANNGGGTDGQEYTFPAVSLTAGDFYYIANDSMNVFNFLGFYPDDESGTIAGFNGDDAIELYKFGAVVDIMGDVNTDGSGQTWDHVDSWAYRNAATGPDGDVFVETNWTFAGANILDGATDNATSANPFPFGTYIPPVLPVVTTECTGPFAFTTDCSVMGGMIDVVQADSVWTGPLMTFTKADNADWTMAANQDSLTPNVILTRANNQGLFNIATETGYVDFFSPSDTEWAYGTTANLASLTFADWETTNGSNPPSMVGQDMVLHLISDNIYIDIKFLSWSSGGSGGGFSYERSTPTPPSNNVINVCANDGEADEISVSLTGNTGTNSQYVITDDAGVIIDLPAGTGPFDFETYAAGTYAIWHLSFEPGLMGAAVGNNATALTGCFDLSNPIIVEVGVPTMSMENYTGCSGDGYSVMVNGNMYDETNPTGTEVLMNSSGCDSTVTIDLIFNPLDTTFVEYAGCSGDGYSVMVNGNMYDETNPTGTEVLANMNGCDSTVFVDLMFNPLDTTMVEYEGCVGDGHSVTVGTEVFDETNPSGMATIPGSDGCDSTVMVNLVFNTTLFTDIDYSGCANDGFSVEVNGVTYDESNPTGTETMQSFLGCDSIITVNLVFLPNSEEAVVYEGCEDDGYSVMVNGTMYDENNPTGTEVMTAANGCDSIVTVDLVFSPTTFGVEEYGGCKGDGYSVVVNGTTYDENNPVGTEVMMNATGCDSIVDVTLVFSPTIVVQVMDVVGSTGNDGSIDIEVSGGIAPYTYEWSNGSTEEDPTGLAPGDYIVTVTDSNGCSYTLDAVNVDDAVSVTDIEGLNQFTLAPNPASNYVGVMLDFADANDIRLQVVSALGQVVIDNRYEGVTQTTIDLDVNQLTPGYYSVRIITDENAQAVEGLMIHK